MNKCENHSVTLFKDLTSSLVCFKTSCYQLSDCVGEGKVTTPEKIQELVGFHSAVSTG